MKTYRDAGAFGALIDEYEKAVRELQDLLKTVSPAELIAVADAETKDPDCKSIQTILTHVVCSGYGYVDAIRISLGEDLKYKRKTPRGSLADYQKDLDAMMAYNVQLLTDHPNLKLEEYAPEKKIQVRWGQLYDPEQLLEHAIVHILRHRRQIERFLIRLRA